MDKFKGLKFLHSVLVRSFDWLFTVLIDNDIETAYKFQVMEAYIPWGYRIINNRSPRYCHWNKMAQTTNLNCYKIGR